MKGATVSAASTWRMSAVVSCLTSKLTMHRLKCLTVLLIMAVLGMFWTSSSTPDVSYYRSKSRRSWVSNTSRGCLRETLDSFHSEIDRIRDRLLEEHVELSGRWRCFSKPTPVHADEKDYFEQVSRQKDITTVFVRVAPDCVLRKGYYTSRFNDCKHLEYGLRKMNVTCTTENKNTHIATLPSAELNVGLSPGSQQLANAGAAGDNLTVLTYLHVIPDAEVDYHGDVIHGGVRIVPHRCQSRIQTECTLLRQVFTQWHSTHAEVFTVSQHWGEGAVHGIENMARLAPYLDFLRRHPKIQVHVASRLHDSLLGVVGLDPRRLVTGTVRARVLYMPAEMPCGDVPVLPIQLLSSALQEPLLEHQATRRRDLVVLVEGTVEGFFALHEDIRRVLGHHTSGMNLTLVTYPAVSPPALKDTMEIFHRAVAIVAPHGAAEVNMIYSRPGTVVIEGVCRRGGAGFSLRYRNLAYRLGLRYYGLTYIKGCELISTEEVEMAFLRLVKYPVDG